MNQDKKFQIEVIERDGSCILNSIRLDCLYTIASAHHLIKRRYLKSRHDMRNGAGLCQNCHAYAHAEEAEAEKIIINVFITRGIWESFEAWEDYKREVKK